MKNRKHYLKARKKLFKWKKLCFPMDSRCPYCDRKTILQYYKYDAKFCISCNIWLNAACNDPGCPFCRNRPESPYEAFYYEDMEACSALERKDWRRYNYQHKADGKKKHERFKYRQQ